MPSDPQQAENQIELFIHSLIGNVTDAGFFKGGADGDFLIRW